MFSPAKIRNIELAPPLILAPMSGVTCSAFRRLLKELNPGAIGYVVSEFISVEGLTRASPRSKEMMKFNEAERPVGIQIFGWDIDRLRDAAKMVEDSGADILDLNCGCPAPKVVKRGGGCELMRQPEHLQKICAEIRKAVKIPFTLKMRSGWADDSRNAVEIAKLVVGEGVEAITVHGRTREQLYRGVADYSITEAVAAAVSVPVFGSGDVVDTASAQARMKDGVQGLYVGRAAMSNPLVFSEILSGKSGTLKGNGLYMAKILLRYTDLLQEDYPPHHCTGRMKQLTTQMAKGMNWRVAMLRAMTLDAQRHVLSEVIANGGSLPKTHPTLQVDAHGAAAVMATTPQSDEIISCELPEI